MKNAIKINSNLTIEQGVNDSNASFRLGLHTLCKNKIGFARVFFQDAANSGNERAKKYLTLLESREVSVANWRQKVIDLESKYLIFGE